MSRLKRMACRVVRHSWSAWQRPFPEDGVEWDRTCFRCHVYQLGGFGKRPNYKRLVTKHIYVKGLILK